MTDDFINQSQLAGAAAVACSDLLGIVSFTIFMRHSSFVPSVVIPSEQSVHQNAKKKTERWIHGQHDDAECRTMMCRKVVVANPMCRWPNQCASSDKAE
jgi:hypothetical protein